ncbi:MAG TPA: 23S rRNA (adenine(2503)-C(2))-methyltransferase RlmN, partial [Eubacteriaceae bacterium]|nr:23S rRNA (adenine(2503)-C(2))-methyltransferase RlmN [Eubacteriaceae bacterium]
MIYLLGKTKEEIAEEMEALGHQKFRAKQLYHWIYTGTDDFDKMNNIPKDLKNRLKDGYRLRSMQIVSEQEDENDQTKKYLFELEDGNTIEAVLMRYSHGETICISTQVGCNMGCDFCASAIG